MHSALLARLQSRPEVLRDISHLFSKWGKKLGVFALFPEREQGPEWVAKIARSPRAVAALIREEAALRYLEPWADALRIPRVLSWDVSPQSACLVQSGIAGRPISITLDTAASGAAVAARLRKPLEWLERFQRLVPLPRNITVASRLSELLQESRGLPRCRRGLEILTALATREIPFFSGPAEVAHGDFAPCNMLDSPAGVGVIDWEQFAARLPLRDLFTLVLSIQYHRRGRPCGFVETYRHALFSESPVCRMVTSHAAGLGLGAEALRVCFYAYLVKRMTFQYVRGSDWEALLNYLGTVDYPPPGRILPLEGALQADGRQSCNSNR